MWGFWVYGLRAKGFMGSGWFKDLGMRGQGVGSFGGVQGLGFEGFRVRGWAFNGLGVSYFEVLDLG